MPRPTADFDRLHPRWPDGAPMGLGGQFRPTGIPPHVAQLFLGTAQLVSELRVGGSLQRRYRLRFKAANSRARDVDWSSMSHDRQTAEMRSILNYSVFDPMGPTPIARLAADVGHLHSNTQNVRRALNRAQLRGASPEVLALIRSPASGALAERLATGETFDGTQTLEPGDYLLDRFGSGAMHFVGTTPTGRLRFETIGGQPTGSGRRRSARTQAYVPTSPTLRGRRIRRRNESSSPAPEAEAEPRESTQTSTGRLSVARRQETGRIRNIDAMTDTNLIELARQMSTPPDQNDEEAVGRINQALRRRGLAEHVIPRGSVRRLYTPEALRRRPLAFFELMVNNVRTADERANVQAELSNRNVAGVSSDVQRRIADLQMVLQRRAVEAGIPGAVSAPTDDQLTLQSAQARTPSALNAQALEAQLRDLRSAFEGAPGTAAQSYVEEIERWEAALASRYREDNRVTGNLEPHVGVVDASGFPISVDSRVQLTHAHTSTDRGVYRVVEPTLDRDGDLILHDDEAVLEWASPEHVRVVSSDSGVREVENPRVLDAERNPVADSRGYSIRRGDVVLTTSSAAIPDLAGRITSAETDASGRVEVRRVAERDQTIHVPPGDLAVLDPEDHDLVVSTEPDTRSGVDRAAPQPPGALPHAYPFNARELAENVLAAFRNRDQTESDFELPRGSSLEVRTPPSGAVSRIVLVRPGRGEETFAYVRFHNRDGNHQISFAHGSDQALGSALRPGFFRNRPHGAAHRRFRHQESNRAAAVLQNALASATRRVAPDSGAPRPSRRPGEVPLPGMMATPRRGRSGWGSAPWGVMLPPRDGDERAFGIEIEMTGLSFGNARAALQREGLPVDNRESYSSKNLAAWLACQDGSLGYGDPEIKIPPLSGEEGMELMRRTVKALRDAGGRAGRQRTHGLHVHIDARDMSSREKRLQLAETYSNNRDLINTIVAPNRNAGSGSYAREGYSAGHGSNELALNFGSPTIEFRRLGSNLVADDIEGWAVLMRCIVNYQKHHDGALPTQSSLLTLMNALDVPVDAQEKILRRVQRITPSETEE